MGEYSKFWIEYLSYSNGTQFEKRVFVNVGIAPRPSRKCPPKMSLPTVDDGSPSKQERKSRKSLLWQYYRRILLLQAQCKKCQCVIQTPIRTTTTLQNHLKQHTSLMEENKEDTANALSMNQPMLVNVVHKRQPLSQKKENTLHQKAAEMVALDLQPYSTIRECRSRALMREALPGYILPFWKNTIVCAYFVPLQWDKSKGAGWTSKSI